MSTLACTQQNLVVSVMMCSVLLNRDNRQVDWSPRISRSLHVKLDVHKCLLVYLVNLLHLDLLLVKGAQRSLLFALVHTRTSCLFQHTEDLRGFHVQHLQCVQVIAVNTCIVYNKSSSSSTDLCDPALHYQEVGIVDIELH